MNLTATRRAFLRRIGLATAASTLPFHRGILRAQPKTEIPQRFIGLKYCNGIQRDLWFPKPTESDVALDAAMLPELLGVFAAFTSQLIVPKNLSLAASRQAAGSHDSGMFSFLTGEEMRLGGSISIDQHIANERGKLSPIPSLQLGTKAFRSVSHGAISFRGPNQAMRPIIDPFVAYDQTFAELKGAATPADLARLRAERHSVLDGVAEDLHDLAAALGGADRERLEFNLESVRQVEQSLTAAIEECVAPDRGDVVDIADDANVPTISKLQMEILAAALACRLTNVATHTWSAGAGNFKLPWLDIYTIVHGLSHWNDNPDVLKPQHAAALKWHFEQMAYLLSLLEEAKEEDGKSILHHSLVLIGTDNGQSIGHEITHIPFLLAGSAGGALRTGRCITYPDPTPHNDLLIAIAHIFKAPVETFGNVKYCSGPLTGLT